MSEIISERMPSVRILQATPGKLHRRKAEVVSTAELRQEAAQLSALPQDRFRLVWQGTVLGEGFDISKLTDNAMVMVIPIAAPPQPSSSVPEPVVVSDEEVKRFQLAFGSALRNPAFSKVVKRLLTRENMETLAAACPGLSQDLVAQAFLTRPELLIQLLDADTLRGIGTKHPALLEAAHNVAAAVHEEQATSSRNPAGVTEDAVAESEPGSYFLDEMSDEEMDEDESGGGGARSTRGNNQITAGQLASALAAATGGGAGVGDSVSSVNRTLFSILVFRYRLRSRPTSPSIRTWNRTPTASSLVYGFKRHPNRSKGAARRCTESRSQTY